MAAVVIAVALGAVVTAGSEDAELRVHWRLRTEAPTVGAPSVENAGVYVATRTGSLVAADAEGGTPRWRFEAGVPAASGPVASGGTVYLVTESAADGGGRLFAVDARTGSEQWRFAAERPFAGAPAVDDGVVFVSAGDVIALDAATGEERWRRAVAGAGPIAAGSGLVAMSTPDGVLALDAASGEERWSATTSSPPAFAPLMAGPTVVADDGLGTLFGLSVTDGHEQWRIPTSGPLHPPVGAGRLLAVAIADGVIGVDSTTGQQRWRVPPPDHRPDGDITVASDGTTVAVAGDRLVLLDSASGRSLGSAEIEGATRASPAVSGGRAYLASGTTLEALSPEPP